MTDTVENKIILLLVEDDLPTQDFMRIAMGPRFEILIAVSAIEAREIVFNQHVDIVLMDLSIRGEEDGIQLTMQIREKEGVKDIPIIALTAHAYDRDRENALRAGCNAYFSKPFNHKDLLVVIDSLLAARKH